MQKIDLTLKNVFDKVIAIDPGHGIDMIGKGDPGATDPIDPQEGDQFDTKEYLLNYDMAVKVKAALNAKGYYKVMLTRGPNEFKLLHQRAIIANNSGASIFVSLHFNAVWKSPKTEGLEAFSAAGSELGAKLRDAILTECLKVYPKRRRVETEDFTVLTATLMPAALIEYGFITNPAEEKMANDPAWRCRMAEATAQGIDNYMKSFLKPSK